MKVIRTVRLPDGRVCEEIETVIQGASETQALYQYIQGTKILSKNCFTTDYWGQIENVKYLD